jgi:molecular chaperone GrpE (heat shock protein)
MADLTQYMTQKYTKLIAEIAADLGKTADDLANAQNIIKALKNPDMMVNGVSLTLDMVQVMENGDIRLLPPPPAPAITETCVKAPEPDKNGKKDSKELVNAS